VEKLNSDSIIDLGNSTGNPFNEKKNMLGMN
jgi:hypothetical protein